jgi:hypothetical protein
MFHNFSSENYAAYEVIWKNTMEPDRSQKAIYYGACTFDVG